MIAPLKDPRATGRHPAADYGLALAIVAAGFLARLALHPVFHHNHTFTVFYPGVIVAAYFLGARPAALVAAASAALAYWAFAHPMFAPKTDWAVLTTMTFFFITSAVSTYFITGMRKALAELAEARARAEALAASHTELFANLNERVTNHLQLVAALLQLQARDARDKTMAHALTEASARTLLISRAHRNLGGQLEQTLDFDAFAGQLLDAALAAQAHKTGVQVVIEPMGAQLSLDEATSVAVVLLECLQARLQTDTPATLRIGLRREARQARLTVAETAGGLAPTAPDLRLYLIEAVVEQLGGRFSSRASPGEIVSELVFPVGAAEPAPRPDHRVLH